MTETSLLQAIETMIDRKLEPIREDMARMKQDLSGIRQEQATMRRDITADSQALVGTKQNLRN